jgi:predicted ester cyclase
MTDEERKQVLRRQIEGFNAHDEKLFTEPLAENATATDVPTGEIFKGKEGGRENFTRWHQAFPDGRVTIKQELVSGDTVVLQFTGEGTQSGPLGPFPASNKRAKTEFVSINKLDTSGKIVRSDLFYDQLSLLMQLGHVPIPAGAGAPR